MDVISKFVLSVLSFCSTVFTLSTIINFTKFLSDFSPEVNLSLAASISKPLGDSGAAVPYTIEAVIVDVSLLCIFIILHSSLFPVHEIISSMLRMPVLNRLFYSLLTSGSLQLLIRWWLPIPQYTMWTIETQETTKLHVLFGVHVVSWMLIYVMMITVDITDLLGIKQVYYHVTGRPAAFKSEKLKQLHKQMRHPSFIGFLIIFWTHPCMRLDRLLLASVWTLYMLLAWRVDTSTYNYLVQQNIAKRSVL